MKVGAAASLVAAVITLTVGIPSANASGEYEPNDSFNAAWGPIAAGHVYSGALETTNDEDYFYFYVPRQTQLQYSFSETDDKDTYLCAELYQQTATGPNSIYGSGLTVDSGETGYGAVTLSRGKYYFVVNCPGAIGEPYSFQLGPVGATSTYAPLAARVRRRPPGRDAVEASVGEGEAQARQGEGTAQAQAGSPPQGQGPEEEGQASRGTCSRGLRMFRAALSRPQLASPPIAWRAPARCR